MHRPLMHAPAPQLIGEPAPPVRDAYTLAPIIKAHSHPAADLCVVPLYAGVRCCGGDRPPAIEEVRRAPAGLACGKRQPSAAADAAAALLWPLPLHVSC